MSTIDLLGLKGSVVLITGGGAGIGKSCAVKFAQAGCDVAVADLDVKAGESTVEEVRALGQKAIFIEVDVCSSEQITSMVSKAFEEFGRIDICVNNVGGPATIGSFLDCSEDEWDLNQAMNLKSIFLCCQREVIAMIEHGIKGRIINVASSSGVVAAPSISPYGAAKAGVIHFTKSIALELAEYDLRVNCVVPGTHATERIRASLDTGGPQAEFLKLAAKSTPMGRLGDPAETAGVVVFLASSLSSYMTGHSVISDGGITHTTQRPAVGGSVRPAALAHINLNEG